MNNYLNLDEIKKKIESPSSMDLVEGIQIVFSLLKEIENALVLRIEYLSKEVQFWIIEYFKKEEELYKIKNKINDKTDTGENEERGS